MRRRALAVLLALAILLPSAGAAGQGSWEELTLRVAMQDDIKSLNPIHVSDYWSWCVLKWIYETPVLMDYDTQELMPYIAIGTANLSGKAESWDDCAVGNFGYSPQSVWQDPARQEAIIFYDFTNVTWHDGTPMTVRDVLFSFHLTAQIPEWSPSVNPLKDLGGRAGTNYSQASWLHIQTVWEDGDKAALRFQLQEPYIDFFRTTAWPLLLPYHIWAYKTSGQAVDGAKIWCDPDYNASADDSWKVAPAQSYNNDPPIGSGIFKFNYRSVGRFVRVSTYRDHFYGPEFAYKGFIEANFPEQKVKQPTIDAISFQVYRTTESAVLALKDGLIDHILWSISYYSDTFRDNPDISLFRGPDDAFFYLGYNMRRQSFGYNESKSFPYSPEDDLGKPLRRAIAHCIDKERIVSKLLLNLGTAGNGPVSPRSEWYNASAPTYQFDPSAAKRILADAGYKVKMSDGTLLSGQAAMDAAGYGNWWVNPDGTHLGSGSHGIIYIYAPYATYDPIRAQAGMIIAEQLKAVGIHAEANFICFAQVIDFVYNWKNFDMFILDKPINPGDPTGHLYSMFHSANLFGQNLAGYQNASYDALFDWGPYYPLSYDRDNTGLVDEAQSAICYDLPVDVLYWKHSIFAAARMYGWVQQGSNIFNRDSIVNLRGPYKYTLHAGFLRAPSAVRSNSTSAITITVTGDGGAPMEGASVALNASVGRLSAEGGFTNVGGMLSVTFTAPYVAPTPDNIANGSAAFIQITSATCGDPDYSPAASRYVLIWVYPEDAKFIAVSASADPDVIADLGADSITPGFTQVAVEVLDQDGLPVPGALVNLTSSGDLAISPANATTGQDGRAEFRVAAPNLTADDGSVTEFVLVATAISNAAGTSLSAQNTLSLYVLDRAPGQDLPSDGEPSDDGPPDDLAEEAGFPAAAVGVAAAAIVLAAVASYAIIRRRRK